MSVWERETGIFLQLGEQFWVFTECDGCEVAFGVSSCMSLKVDKFDLRTKRRKKATKSGRRSSLELNG